jgi:hypothetical protein
MFGDAHHPGLNAVVLMAREVIRLLKSRGAFSWPMDIPAPTFTMAECITRFELDQSVWIAVCLRSMAFYNMVRGGRHDPSWRDSVVVRYRRAYEMLERGTPPDQTGVPAFRIRDELRAELPPD